MTILVRAVRALALLAGFYLLALVLGVMVPALAVIGMVYVASWTASAWFVPVYLLFLVATLTLAWAILRGVFARPADSRTRIPVPDGSELWPIVTGLAKRVGTAPPKYLYLCPDADVNAEVRESARWLGLLGWTRTMDIGVLLLAALSPDQLQAVLGHELGHYSRSDTRLLPLIYRGHVIIKATVARLLEISDSRRMLLTTAWTWLFARYALRYLRSSTAVLRRQELHADAQAAQTVQETLQQREAEHAERQHLTGVEARTAAAQVTGQALVLAHAVPDAWADFLTRCPTLAPRHECSPGQLFIAFQHMVTDSGYQQDLAGFQLAALNRPAEPFDTHPSLTERLRNLGLADAADAISPAGRNPLLGDLQPHLAPVAQRIHRAATESAATAKTADTDTAERPYGVVRIDLGIDLDDGHSVFWRTIAVIAPILTVLAIVGFLWSVGHSNPGAPINPVPPTIYNPVPPPVYIPTPVPPLPTVSFLTPILVTSP